MSLHGRSGGRKYLNAAERRRFQEAALTMPAETRLLCLVLMWSGCRVSEALAITPLAIDLEAGTLSLETLKKRTRGIVRQVPLPPTLLSELDRVFEVAALQRDPNHAARRLWNSSRSTAWRQVKKVMRLAGITGGAAMPKGLRHTFGVAAFQTVPPHLVQRWLGHASLRSTAIYGDVSSAEERSFAERVWRHW